ITGNLAPFKRLLGRTLLTLPCDYDKHQENRSCYRDITTSTSLAMSCRQCWKLFSLYMLKATLYSHGVNLVSVPTR
ncbi:hypothetical protein L9F63_007430, partial [Diploptera punctata]